MGEAPKIQSSKPGHRRALSLHWRWRQKLLMRARANGSRALRCRQLPEKILQSDWQL